MKSQESIKAICIQTNPEIGNIKKNMDEIMSYLSNLNKPDLDLIILPETCLTGYVFENGNEMKKFAECCAEGIQFEFFSNIAKQYKAYVFAGYPENGNDNNHYNSLYCINREGKLILNYRKTFL